MAWSLYKQGKGWVHQPPYVTVVRKVLVAKRLPAPSPISLFPSLDISSFQLIKEKVMSCVINAKVAFSRSDTKHGQNAEALFARADIQTSVII